TVALSPDGETLATGNEQGKVVLLEVKTGRRRLTLEGHAHAVRRLAFSPDGKVIASGSGSYRDGPKSLPGEVKLRDAATGKEIRPLVGDAGGELNGLSFSADGRTLAWVTDYVVRLTDVATGQERARLDADGSRPLCAVYSPTEA